MKTPAEKYSSDISYKRLVDMMENLIHQAEFTPSELREACLLAHINYERRNLKNYLIADPDVINAIKTLDKCFIDRRTESDNTNARG